MQVVLRDDRGQMIAKIEDGHARHFVSNVLPSMSTRTATAKDFNKQIFILNQVERIGLSDITVFLWEDSQIIIER